MNMDKKLNCQECGKKAVYREKGGELYCQKCHNKGEKVLGEKKESWRNY